MSRARPRFRPLPWPLGPIAHRGLHDVAKGLIENTPSAIEAAIARSYAVEIDVQAAAADEPVVFHDETLERLTHGTGPVAAMTPAQLQELPMRVGSDRIGTLAAVLEQVAGRTPLYIEVKTAFRGPGRYERRIAEALAAYKGPVAVMSFDPDAVQALRELLPGVPRGIVSYRWDDGWLADQLGLARRLALRSLLPARLAKPDFLAYDVDALPGLVPLTFCRLLRVPLLAWTVRTTAQRAKAAKYADAIIFEGFEP